MSWGTSASLKKCVHISPRWFSDTFSKISVCFHGYVNFDFLCYPSVLLSPLQPVRRWWASGGTVWIYKLACTPLQGNTLVWTIVCTPLYTSGGPTLAFVTQWLSLMMLFGSEEPQSLIQIENNVVYLSLDPNIIFDVTMVSSAEIPWYFRLSRETQEAAGVLFISS